MSWGVRMQYKTIGEICTVVSGTTPKSDKAEYWGGNLIWITPAELKEGNAVIYDSVRHITKAAVKASALKPFPKGTVILSSRAPIGKVAIAGTQMYCNQGFKNLICSEVIYNGYLYYYLKAKTAYLNSLGRGATFREISKQIVEKIKIPVPSMQEQHRIADILFKIDALMGKRQQQAEKLDELVKARFVEMFGDPVLNTRRLPSVSGTSLFKLSNGKAVPAEKRFDSGIPAYGGNGISWYTDEALINTDTLVVGRVGFQSGNVHFVYGPLWITDNAMYVTWYRKELICLRFLNQLMKRVDFSRYQDAGDLKKITQKPFMKFEYILPSMNLQMEFVNFMDSVNCEKERIQRSAALLETLKRSLMQQYFG